MQVNFRNKLLFICLLTLPHLTIAGSGPQIHPDEAFEPPIGIIGLSQPIDDLVLTADQLEKLKVARDEVLRKRRMFEHFSREEARRRELDDPASSDSDSEPEPDSDSDSEIGERLIYQSSPEYFDSLIVRMLALEESKEIFSDEYKELQQSALTFVHRMGE